MGLKMVFTSGDFCTAPALWSPNLPRTTGPKAPDFLCLNSPGEMAVSGRSREVVLPLDLAPVRPLLAGCVHGRWGHGKALPTCPGRLGKPGLQCGNPAPP